MSVLTPRQVEFLVHAANGLKREQIAEACSVSPWTVKATLDDARVRLGVRTTGQAVLKAIGAQLIVVDHEGHVLDPSTS